MEYPTIADLVAEVRQPALYGDKVHGEPRSDAWNGNVTTAQAADMLAGAGCATLGDKVRARMMELEPETRSMDASGAAWGVSGAIVDVERYLAGDPECMLDMFAPGNVVKTVEVWVGIAASATFKPQEIIERGAAICAIVDAMERSGVRVKIVWCATEKAVFGADAGSTYTMHGPLKDYTEALDVDLVAFVLAHPAFLRRIMFRAWDRQCPTLPDQGYGEPVATKVPEGALYVPHMNSGESYWGRNTMGTLKRIFNLTGEDGQ